MGNIHSARHYLLQVVLPAYEALAATLMDGVTGDRRDLLAVGESAEACLNLADHIAKEPTCKAMIPGAPKAKAYVAELTSKYKSFAITRDIANAVKHRTISRDGRTLEGISSIIERWALIQFKDQKGVYWATRKVVIVRLTNNVELFAEDVIFDCISIWLSELLRLSQIPEAPLVDRAPQRLMLRKDVPVQPCFEMRAVQGEYFESQPIILQYDSKLDIYKPMREKIGQVDIKCNMVVEPSKFPSIKNAGNSEH